MVAEKPSLAQSLASILSNKNYNSYKGFNGACSVFEWNGIFKGESVQFKMTSVCGHVMSLDFIGKYNNWDSVDPVSIFCLKYFNVTFNSLQWSWQVELFTCRTEKKEATPKLKMPAFLAHEAKGASYAVLWLDCDKEGENICFEVINEISPVMCRPHRNEPVVFRAKFSAITEKDIKMAMNSLIFPNENESKSVDARQEIDLRIGCAFTRFQTKFFQVFAKAQVVKLNKCE